MNQILALSGCTHFPMQLIGENKVLNWQWLATGILKIEPSSSFTHQVKQKVLISTGIHGNETAPIEIVSEIVCKLLNGEMSLTVSLLVVFGNIQAIEEGVRFIDADLNRMFNGRYVNYFDATESKRAEEIENYVKQFFVLDNKSSQNFHFDLHTAIRGSAHKKFGLIPQQLKADGKCYFNWLISMGLEALVVNLKPSSTFSSFTSNQCEAMSCTLELGKANPFGQNELTNYRTIHKVLVKLIQGIDSQVTEIDKPAIYLVEQELIKLSDRFKFIAIDDNAENFTCYKKGTLIAKDDGVRYQVKNELEWILFPNALVKKGLRAGILLSKGSIENLFIDKACH
jgi:succinylglutamate desuccinylase